MKPWHIKHFSTKLILLLMGLGISVIAILSIVSANTVIRSVKLQMQTDGTTLARSLVHQIQEINLEDGIKIHEVFQSLKEMSNESIAYISLTNPDGVLMVSDAGYTADAVSSATETSEQNSEVGTEDSLKIQVSKDVFNISEPVGDTGYVLNLGLSLLDMNEALRRTLQKLTFYSAIILVFLVILGLYASKWMMRPLRKTMSGINKLAQGELEWTIITSSDDEFGQLNQALYHLTQHFQDILGQNQRVIEDLYLAVGQLQEGNASFLLSSEQVSTANEQVAKEMHVQKDAISSLTMANETLGNTFKDMKTSADLVANRNESIRETTLEGQHSLNTLTDALNQIERVFSEGTDQIHSMSDSFKGITAISDVIGDVANQTNLLALNAAIEAARAGESGKGFAVVAEEIKKLTEEVIEASGNIHKSVSHLQGQVQKVSEKNTNIAKEMSKQGDLVNTTVMRFNTISEHVHSATGYVSELLNHISVVDLDRDKLSMQISNLTIVNENMQSIEEEIRSALVDQNEQQNSLETTVERLTQMAETLKESSSHFKL